MTHPQKRIIGSEAMKVRPALEISDLRRRKTVPVWLWLVLCVAVVAVIAGGAWIDATTGVPVCGAIFLFIGWRLWRAA